MLDCDTILLTKAFDADMIANTNQSDSNPNGWVNIDSATTEAYTTSATDMDCSGFQYKCVVTNAKGSVESSVVTLTVTKASEETTEYHITEGANQSIAENYDGTITIKADGELSKFVSVSMDGNIVDAANYTVKSGSTIVTFTKAYLDTLSVGNHTVRFTYTDGYVEAALTITQAAAQPEEDDTADTTEDTTTEPDTNKEEKDEVPKTGDETPVIWLFVLMLGSGVAL